jgi:DNA-binding NtrC family response regulator
VIMVTGHGTIETAIEATKLGAFNFIPKPFTPSELAKVAVEALAA